MYQMSYFKDIQGTQVDYLEVVQGDLDESFKDMQGDPVNDK